MIEQVVDYIIAPILKFYLRLFTYFIVCILVSDKSYELKSELNTACESGYEVKDIEECKDACKQLGYDLSTKNSFKAGEPCFLNGKHVCNQNGAHGKLSKRICKKKGKWI